MKKRRRKQEEYCPEVDVGGCLFLGIMLLTIGLNVFDLLNTSGNL